MSRTLLVSTVGFREALAALSTDDEDGSTPTRRTVLRSVTYACGTRGLVWVDPDDPDGEGMDAVQWADVPLKTRA